MKNQLYRRYSNYLKTKYGEKVYKLPLNLPLTCPNRDGSIHHTGCTFYGDMGAGHESLSNSISIQEQLENNKRYISKRYKANKFIAYMQNFSNTYMPLETFKGCINQCIMDGIVEIAISTRPDCINETYLQFLSQIKAEKSIEISFELGLQTVNYHTLKKINRGHTLAEFIDAVLRIKKYNFPVCAHVILNLPDDILMDTIETAKIISALNVDQVKLHSLYIVKDTKLAKAYEEGEINMITCDDYKNRVITFLEYLSPDVVIQRIMARAPETDTVFANWGRSWWVIRDEIEETMRQEGKFQGKKYDYLNGSALKFL